MPTSLVAVSAITAVLVWLWGCSQAETWLEKRGKDHQYRMTFAPFLGIIWIPFWLLKKFVYHFYVKPAQELCAALKAKERNR